MLVQKEEDRTGRRTPVSWPPGVCWPCPGAYTVYAMKLKLEFTILNQLMSMTKAGPIEENRRRGGPNTEFHNQIFSNSSPPRAKSSIGNAFGAVHEPQTDGIFHTPHGIQDAASTGVYQACQRLLSRSRSRSRLAILHRSDQRNVRSLVIKSDSIRASLSFPLRKLPPGEAGQEFIGESVWILRRREME